MPKERSTAEPKDRRVSRRTKERAFPPTMGRTRLLLPEGRADHGASGLITARGMRRPWGGRACCSPRGAPTMGRARLSQPEGRADHGAGALVAARGARRPWGGRAYHSPRDAPTMGERAYHSPRDAPTMGRARLLQPGGRADYGAGALIAAAPRQNLQKLFSDHVLWQGVRSR